MTHRALRIEQSPLERARLWVEILAFAAAGCWALYTFVYQTKIAPALLPPHEVVSVNVRRLATTPSGYLERVDVTIVNDGSVDVDTAALAVTLFGLRPSSEVNLQSRNAGFQDFYRTLPVTAWEPLQSRGMLFDAAIAGRRGQHYILRPGDRTSDQELALVPRRYGVLKASIQTNFGRYPIEPRVDITLVRKNGSILLRSKYISISSDSYFGI